MFGLARAQPAVCQFLTNVITPRVGLRGLHVTRPLQASFGSKLFRAFRKKDNVRSDGSPRLSLLNQASLPEDLRLPKPGDPLNRVGAGFVDAFLSVIGGGLVGGATYAATGGAIDISVAAGQGVSLFLWAIRDVLGDHGNRSVGKRLFRLEITQRDGILATPMSCLGRSAYFLLAPFTVLHPYIGMSFEVLLFWDVATLFLTSDARKAGDYACGTRVVDERGQAASKGQQGQEAADRAQAREQRVQEMYVVEEVRELREKIERGMPGLLAARERADPALSWYENARWQIAGGSAATQSTGIPMPKAAQYTGRAADGVDALFGAGLPTGLRSGFGTQQPMTVQADSKTDLLRPLRKPGVEPRPSIFDTAPRIRAGLPGSVAVQVGSSAASEGGLPAPGMGGLFDEIRTSQVEDAHAASGASSGSVTGSEHSISSSSAGPPKGSSVIAGRTLFVHKPKPRKD